jgi:hypothetical protein
VLSNEKTSFLREIKTDEVRKWKPQKQSVVLGIIESFLSSKMKMAEVNMEALPEPEQKAGSKIKSTKQDSFASSFYAWKKKKSTQQYLSQLGIDVLLFRRGEKIALKKEPRSK